MLIRKSDRYQCGNEAHHEGIKYYQSNLRS